MKIIDNGLLDEVSRQAAESPRLRMNYNFHDTLEANAQRLLNALEPGTYLSPHRHKNPDKEEYLPRRLISCCAVKLTCFFMMMTSG